MFGGINNIYMGGYKFSAHCTNISAHKIYFRAQDIFPRIIIYMWGIFPQSDSHSRMRVDMEIAYLCGGEVSALNHWLIRFSEHGQLVRG